MASVHLDFLPPDRPGFEKLYIYESPTPDGALVQIEEVLAIGSYPTYLSEYTTELATSVNNWFAIAWEDDKGAKTEVSVRIQGNTATLPGKLVRRVMLADASMNEIIVSQAAEYIVSQIMKTEDPYDITLAPTYKQMEAMTLLTQAHALLRTMASGSGQSSGWTAGLVSMKSATDPSKNIKELIDYLTAAAADFLGLRVGVVAQMLVPEIAGGLSEIIREDVSRLELVEEL